MSDRKSSTTEGDSTQFQLSLPFTDWMDVQLRLPESQSPIHISGPLLTVMLSLTRFVLPFVVDENRGGLRFLRRALLDAVRDRERKGTITNILK